MNRKIPNLLTFSRMIIAPFLLFFYPFRWEWTNFLAASLFTIGALTDFFDGFIARKIGGITKLGMLFDPIADKVLTTAALLLLARYQLAPTPFVGLLLIRDIAVTGLRLSLGSQQDKDLPVQVMGKLKTLVLDVSIVFLLLDQNIFGFPCREIGMGSFWLAFILSLYSGVIYFQKALKM